MQSHRVGQSIKACMRLLLNTLFIYIKLNKLNN